MLMGKCGAKCCVYFEVSRLVSFSLVLNAGLCFDDSV